jgi:hypothetical protein
MASYTTSTAATDDRLIRTPRGIGQSFTGKDSQTAITASGTDLSLSSPGPTIEPSFSIILVDSDNVELASVPDRPYTRQALSMNAQAVDAADTDYKFAGQNVEPSFEIIDIEVDNALFAAIIPMQFFHTVTGTVKDDSGDVIENALYLVGMDALPTAGTVKPDGSYNINLLNQPYDDFFLVVAEPGVPDLVWYSSDESNDPVLSNMDEADLVFTREEVEAGGKRGLSVGAGVSFG